MNADVLKIAIAIFIVGIITSSISLEDNREAEIASAPPAPLQQGVIVAQVPSKQVSAKSAGAEEEPSR